MWKHHARFERHSLVLVIGILLVVAVGGLVEITPLFYLESTIEKVQGMRPYTPLELAGRDIYVAEGCNNCHSQMIRPIRAETMRYGEYSKPGEFVYDHPFLWGSRRIGPDLQRVGGKYPHLWHVRHMQDPRSTTPQSIMPAYPWLARDHVDWRAVGRGVRAQMTLGVPYPRDTAANAAALARTQGQQIAGEIVQQGGPAGLEETKMVALIAYLQRLGTDIKQTTATAAGAGGPGR